MSRNITIIIIILGVVAAAGYLVWLRSQYQPPVTQTEVVESPSPIVSPSPSPVSSPTASASAKPKTGTSSGTTKP